MLGINTPYDAEPKPYRDYYCTNKGDAELAELERLQLVRKYRDDGPEGYDWFTCTPRGKRLAMLSHKTIRHSKSKRVYQRFLSVRDCWPDITFKDFLTDQKFAGIRSEV